MAVWSEVTTWPDVRRWTEVVSMAWIDMRVAEGREGGLKKGMVVWRRAARSTRFLAPSDGHGLLVRIDTFPRTQLLPQDDTLEDFPVETSDRQTLALKFGMAAYASYDDDSLLQPDASTSSLIDLPVLYPPSATPPFPHRPQVLRAFPPAIDPDLPPSDFDDTHSLLASPDQSRSVLQREDDDDDEDEDLDDEAFQEKMDREILGEEGEMTREEEKVAKKAWELGSRILVGEAHNRATEQGASFLLLPFRHPSRQRYSEMIR